MTSSPTPETIAEIQARQANLPRAHWKQANSDVDTLLAALRAQPLGLTPEDKNTIAWARQYAARTPDQILISQVEAHNFAKLISRITAPEPRTPESTQEDTHDALCSHCGVNITRSDAETFPCARPQCSIVAKPKATQEDAHDA